MEIRTRRANDVLIVDMVGRLDSRAVGPASTELNQIAQAGHGKLVLNIHGLEYATSAGLRAILVAARLVQVHGGALKICDANTAVKQVMELSGVSSVLHLYDTDKDALAAFVDEPLRARAHRGVQGLGGTRPQTPGQIVW
jgi:anti-anti-sigma factor